ncbi:MAG: hypothetical protein ACREIQ_09180, partial [Nitrospiria bacterium]
MMSLKLSKIMILSLIGLLSPSLSWAQFEQRKSVFYLYGSYNYATMRAYPEFNAMLNIIDIGHAELAERLMTANSEPDAVRLIDEDLFERVTRMFLGEVRRPRFSPSEETIAPRSVRLAWKVNKAFDWTHYLHRQVYDILSDDQVKDKDKAIREALNYYLTEPDRVFPTRLKSMNLMENQAFSGYWKKRYPKFNGAIWAYHWLQLVANEALLEPDPRIRRTKMELGVSEFKQMFRDPSRLPRHMPIALEVSPTFAKRFPEVAATFDNLHTFHDIYMDVLTNPLVGDKRGEAYRQLAVMLDPEVELETMPAHPLPPIPLDQQQPLLQMDPHEHMV